MRIVRVYENASSTPSRNHHVTYNSVAEILRYNADICPPLELRNVKVGPYDTPAADAVPPLKSRDIYDWKSMFVGSVIPRCDFQPLSTLPTRIFTRSIINTGWSPTLHYSDWVIWSIFLQ
jgi:hypothetical protein